MANIKNVTCRVDGSASVSFMLSYCSDTKEYAIEFDSELNILDGNSPFGTNKLTIPELKILLDSHFNPESGTYPFLAGSCQECEDETELTVEFDDGKLFDEFQDEPFRSPTELALLYLVETNS